MEPRIQYAKTEDGVSIAYWTLGEGPPLLMVNQLLASDVRFEWEIPRARAMYTRLAESATLIRLDPRNHGLSTRGVARPSLDDYVGDVEAVLDRLKPGPVTLFASFEACKVAVCYAVRHPELVTSIVMFGANAAPVRQSSRIPGLRLLGRLVEANWDLYCDLLATVTAGLDDPAFTKQLAQLMRESVLEEDFRASVRALMAADVQEMLPQIQAPLLILHRKTPWFDSDAERNIASAVGDARIAVIDGQYADPWDEPTSTAITEFMAEITPPLSASAATQEANAAEQDLRTILFTDVEGSTALTERLGDAKARELLREHERITRQALKDHGGSEVKTMGDGFMTSFSSATRALECAIAIQSAFAERNRRVGAQGPPALQVRIGLNAGEPIAEDDPGGRGDLFGTAVNMAARVAAKADGGEVLVSNVVRELVAGKTFLFNDRGDTELRGFEEAVRLFELNWRTDSH